MKHWGPSPLWIMWVHSPNRLQKYKHTKYICPVSIGFAMESMFLVGRAN